MKAPLQRVIASSYLVLIELTVLVLLLPLLLKGNNDETDKDVHHEEGDDDDVDDEKDGDLDAVVVDRTHVLLVRVDGLIEQTAGTQKTMDTPYPWKKAVLLKILYNILQAHSYSQNREIKDNIDLAVLLTFFIWVFMNIVGSFRQT